VEASARISFVTIDSCLLVQASLGKTLDLGIPDRTMPVYGVSLTLVLVVFRVDNGWRVPEAELFVSSSSGMLSLSDRWQQLYSLKYHSFGAPSAESCSKRSFPHKGDSSVRLFPFPCSSNNLKQQANRFASPTNCGCQAPTARKFTKPK
jgi:hypothetical protein